MQDLQNSRIDLAINQVGANRQEKFLIANRGKSCLQRKKQ
jgi:hypothetical protein